MSRSFNCPNCGAPLDYKDEGEMTLRCPFCSNSVIVPEELRSIKTASEEQTPTAASPDTEIKPADAVLDRLRDLASHSDNPRELRRIARVERRIVRRQERDEDRKQRRGNIGK